MQPEQAGDVDDVPVAGRDQVRQERLGAVDDAPEVDVHDALDVLEVIVLDVAGEGDTGVVVDLVDRAVVRRDGVGVAQHRVAVGDVEVLGTDRARRSARTAGRSRRGPRGRRRTARAGPRARRARTARARPMPDPAPVTTATLSSNAARSLSSGCYLCSLLGPCRGGQCHDSACVRRGLVRGNIEFLRLPAEREGEARPQRGVVAVLVEVPARAAAGRPERAPPACACRSLVVRALLEFADLEGARARVGRIVASASAT